MKINAYGARSAQTPLAPMAIERRQPGPHDVQIDIAFCGVCHSDLHQVRSEWQGTLYPCVPGHEIVGHVLAVGAEVTKFRMPEHPHPSANVGALIFRRRSVAGSLIGGIAETLEMLDFCAKHKITADIELIRIAEIEEAFNRMQRSDVKYRFVIDNRSLAA